MNAEIVISVVDRAGLVYGISGILRPPVYVNDPLPTTFTEEVGISAHRLRERHLAFLLLVLLDQHEELGSTIIAGKPRPQRLRFSDYLGMTELSFRKWAERNLSAMPAKLLRWNPINIGRDASRTGGPWRLAVNRATVAPDLAGARDFIDRQAVVGIARRSDPVELLEDARRELKGDDWYEAELLLAHARDMFRRRRWKRDNPFWFEILLQLGHARMQLGSHGLIPNDSFNILRSITKQELRGPDASIIRARAHHLAALVWNQRNGSRAAEAVIRHLRLAQDALAGLHGPEAFRKSWEIRAYEEVFLARLNATAPSRRSSVILQATKILPKLSAELEMRYGETLLVAEQPTKALEYIIPASESGLLSSPAWVIAERLTTAAQWGAGASAGATLEVLEDVEHKARALGFDHQVRLIRKQKKRVRDRNRKPMIR